MRCERLKWKYFHLFFHFNFLFSIFESMNSTIRINSLRESFLLYRHRQDANLIENGENRLQFLSHWINLLIPKTMERFCNISFLLCPETSWPSILAKRVLLPDGVECKQFTRCRWCSFAMCSVLGKGSIRVLVGSHKTLEAIDDEAIISFPSNAPQIFREKPDNSVNRHTRTMRTTKENRRKRQMTL